jgi:rhodanese-related sulfurtransferase
MNEIPEIDATEARRLIEGGDAILVDVRETEEWTAGHAPEAHHVPLSELDAEAFLHGKPTVFVCRVGGRAAEATRQLLEVGAPAQNLSGGMYAWHEAGYPVVDDSGNQGQVI